MQERWTSREGFRFAHRRIEHPAPEFPPVLFVSGAFQTMDSWARFARAFAPRTTVLLVDPPGTGHADPLPPEAGIDFLAGCLEQVLDENGVAHASVIAASYGTPIAFRLAAMRPQRVRRIVLGGTMKALPAHMRSRIAATIALARRGDRSALARECVDGMLCHDASKPIDRRAPAMRVLRAGILRMSDADLAKYAKNTQRLLQHEPLELSTVIRGPEALVFTGEHDTFTRPQDCREVAQAFERGWFTTLRRADHLFHLQQWDALIALLLRFASGTLDGAPAAGWNPLEPLNASCAVEAIGQPV